MPSNTFFRLPQEKRQRLLEAAWGEFTRVSLSSVSINQIVLAAHIPRGSFYQYFSGKEDLFRHLLEGTRAHFSDLLVRLLDDHGGDLLALPMAAFDLLSPGTGQSSGELARFVRLLQVNPGADLHQYLLDPDHILQDRLWERVDRSRLRRSDRQSVETLFCLLMSCTAPAILFTLIHPEEAQCQRQLLARRLDLIQFGAETPTPF